MCKSATRIGIRFSFLFIVCCVFAASAAAQKNSYSDMVAKVRGGDTNVDFRAMRMAFVESKEFASGIDSKVKMRMVEAVKAKKFDEVAKASQEILNAEFVNMSAHIYASTAYESLKDKKKADFHKAVYLGLINSVVSDADGESTKTAYKVISVDEENAVLNAYSLQKVSQTDLEEGGSRYHVITATDRATNATSKVYFNIDKMAIARGGEAPK